jgi:aminoglycoside/choline kinase family phosphotransferase
MSIPAPIIEYLERQHVGPCRVVALSGDASDRRYFRVVPAEGGSSVLALYARPFESGALPFVNVAELFAAMPVPVPRVIGHAGDLGIIAQEDLGDLTLQAHLGAAPAAQRAALYEQAVSFIVTIQRRGRELCSPHFVPFGLAFDVEKLDWEMDFFIRHFLEAYRGAALTDAHRAALRQALHAITSALAAEPRVLCHRDYHSRNLMVAAAGTLHVIDFQDARMGPDTYDLVSLLRDSYVDLPEALVDTLIDAYLIQTSRAGQRDTFRRRFDLMALQRNLKALGTFGYQTTTRQNPVYTQYIPRTLRYVRNTLERDGRFAAIRDLLGAHVEEWRT